MLKLKRTLCGYDYYTVVNEIVVFSTIFGNSFKISKYMDVKNVTN